ncbi:HNH endonuclease [Aeromonas phage vB_AsaP_MQM1]|nr:HNH endonuclease [Aeromonas phage vB_AsaP_MQM1]
MDLRRSKRECWEWLHYRDKDGYGIKKIGGKVLRAHRLSFQEANPSSNIVGKVVCHSCDNPCCVNPSHLRAGTMHDNGADLAIRFRQVSKLTLEDIIAIRSSKLSQKELSEIYGVAISTISRIINKKRREYVG